MLTEASRTFRAHPASLRLVREFVRSQATEADLDPIADDLVLAASEAAGNAIVHAVGDQVDVRWRQTEDVIEMEVTDRGVFKRRVPVAMAEGGRGIFVMMALMDEVSIQEGQPGRPGTVVRLRKRVSGL